jgi:hypothetical protein
MRPKEICSCGLYSVPRSSRGPCLGSNRYDGSRSLGAGRHAAYGEVDESTQDNEIRHRWRSWETRREGLHLLILPMVQPSRPTDCWSLVP